MKELNTRIHINHIYNCVVTVTDDTETDDKSGPKIGASGTPKVI